MDAYPLMLMVMVISFTAVARFPNRLCSWWRRPVVGLIGWLLYAQGATIMPPH